MAKSWKESWEKLDWDDASDEKLARQVKDLVKTGADVNAKDDYGVTAPMFAAAHGRTEAVKALVELGADVNAENNDGWTALMYAALHGYTETVKALVELGADVNAKDENGLTALIRAASAGHTETVKALAELGADVNAKNIDGWTALMGAAWNDYTETVKALAELGADINAENNEGKSALDYIKDEKTKREIIKLAAEYQRKQQEKDSSPMAQNDGKKQPENNTVANNLKNAVESRVQGGDTYEVDVNVPFNVTIVVPSHSQATMPVIDANVRSRDE